MPSPIVTTQLTSQEGGVVGWVLGVMESLGEVGVGVAVLAENFFPPIPSEAVLPMAGFLAWEGRMDPVLAVVAATIGSVLGAWGWWAVGRALGRQRTRRIVARLPLLHGEDFDRAERFFARWGPSAVLVGRCVPLVRSFVSIPAGVAHMPFGRFTVYTALGSLVWNSVWIGLGFALGPAVAPALERWSGVLSYAVVAAAALALAWFLVVRLGRRSAPTVAARADRTPVG